MTNWSWISWGMKISAVLSYQRHGHHLQLLVALAFSQMFNLLCERADNTYGGRLPYHVRVLWDEAANTGQVPGLEKSWLSSAPVRSA